VPAPKGDATASVAGAAVKNGRKRPGYRACGTVRSEGAVHAERDEAQASARQPGTFPPRRRIVASEATLCPCHPCLLFCTLDVSPPRPLAPVVARQFVGSTDAGEGAPGG
jgi:hypothetical protein